MKSFVRYKDWPKSKLVEWNSIKSAQSARERTKLCRQEIDRLSGDISLTDVLLHLDSGGMQMMELLASDERGGLRDDRGRRSIGNSRQFTILCLRRPDGSEYATGDEVVWKVGPVTHDELGRPLTANAKRSMMRRGEPLELSNVATVDPSGCITVGFSDASLILSRSGFETSNYREKGRGGTGVYNWLFAEQPLWLQNGPAEQDGLGDPEIKRRGRPRSDCGPN
jgi:hypothetical protein